MVEACEEAYKDVVEISQEHGQPMHPVGLAWSPSSCYKVQHAPERACPSAKQAFQDAVAELGTLNEDS